MGEWMLAVVAALASAVASVAGFGNGLLLSPVAASWLEHSSAVATVNAASIAAAATTLVSDARHARPYGRAAGVLSLSAAVFAVPFSVVVAWLPQAAATAALGAGIVVAAVALASGWSVRVPPGAAGLVGTGAASGFGAVLCGVAGPPLVLYAAARRWDPVRARATQQVVFIVAAAASLLAIRAAHPSASVHAGVLVAAAAGSLAALPLRRRISGARLRPVMLAATGLAGAWVLVSATVQALAGR